MPIAVPEPTAASSSGRSRPSVGGLATITLGIALLLGSSLAGCGRDASDDPLLRKRLISIEGAALTRFLGHAALLEGTPIARQARSGLERIGACPEVWGDFDVPAELAADRDADTRPFDLAALDCRDDASVDPTLRTLVATRRGDHVGLLLWPIGDDGHLEIQIDVDAQGGLGIDGYFVPPSRPGAFALFVPGEEAPAAPALTPSNTLLHLRMRPADGIRLSNLIPAEGQADRLFALKGRLLEGALLSGTWEFAFVAPKEGGRIPLAVGALHHRLAGPIEEALSEALDQLERTWPIRRAPRSFSLADGSSFKGGCFVDLPLLPELAPCWVVTSDALVVGYRGDAIDAVLSPAAVSGAPDGSSEFAGASGLDVHLDRLNAVDGRITPDERVAGPGDLYSKLELRMRADDSGRVQIRGQLRANP
jgi:hypothetical protein